MKWNDLVWFQGNDATDTPSGYIDEDFDDKRYQPCKEDWYRALRETEFEDVKAVIVGQDPYPWPGYATGLAFSIPKDAKDTPPTLINIKKELCSDIHCAWPQSGDLSGWAAQGVLLWNNVLTVEPGKPGSHRGLGWEDLTKEVLEKLYERGKVVFILWGKDAQRNLQHILPPADDRRNRFILSSHPSPLSAHKGFFGSRPFSTCNRLMNELGHDTIDWRIK